MKREIINYFQELWVWLQKMLMDKCGDLPLFDSKPEKECMDEVVEREMVINNTKIHIKSIFTGKISLDGAMKNIVAHRISDAKSEQ